ncbi:MAG: TPM domain-containing protein [Candidatus Woesearchaeota archaeon]
MIFCLFILKSNAQYEEIREKYKLNSFVNDYSNLLSYEEISNIENVLKEIYDSGIAEYSVVIVDSLEGYDIESFSYNLAEGRLGNKEKNNGLLLLIALQDRKYRFEVGRGLEPLLPDVIVARIGRNILEPNFRNFQYGQGILDSSIAIRDFLFNNTESLYYKEFMKKDNSEKYAFMIFFGLIFMVILILIFVNKSNKSIKKRDEDYFVSGFMLGTILNNDNFKGRGGFGGFGGGSFGGGGFSGRW